MENVLVIANQTAVSTALTKRVYELSKEGPITVFLVVPMSLPLDTGGLTPANAARASFDAASRNMTDGVDAIAKLGVQVTGQVGQADPMAAVKDAVDRERIDTIVVSTLPLGASRWLAMDLPHRIARKYGPRRVEHVEVQKGDGGQEGHEDQEAGPRTVNVLLVEDDPSDAELATLALENSGLDVSVAVAPDGAQALHYLQTIRPRPDLVLLDLKMPVLDGHGFLEKLQTELGVDSLNEMYIVVVSSSPAEKDRVRAHALGARAYVVKTPDFQIFETALRSLVHEVASQ